MNLALMLVIVVYVLTRILVKDSPFNRLENRIQKDLIRLQVDPSWFLRTQSAVAEKSCPFEEFYLQYIKSALLKGQKMTEGLESLVKVIQAINLVQAQVRGLWEQLLSKLAFQILLACIVRAILGKVRLQGLDEAVIMIIGAALTLVGLWIFSRLLPKPSLVELQSYQSWLAMIMTAGESQPDSCPGIQDMLVMERKNGIGRKAARLARVTQDLLLRNQEDLRRCERFSDTIAAFELILGAVILGSMLLLPVFEMI